MARLDEAIDQVQTYIRAISGIRAATNVPPDQINIFPFVVCFPFQGVYEISPALVKKGLHTIIIDIHMARRDLARDVEAVDEYIETIVNTLMSKLINDNRWNNKISTFDRIRYEFKEFKYGGQPTIGYRIFVEGVKQENAVT